MTTTKRYILSETVFSAVINTLIGAVAMLLVFGIQPAVGLWGSRGVAVNLIPAVFMMSLMDVIVPTLLVRLRINGGRLVVPAGAPSKWMPNRLVIRAFVLALGLTGVLMPIALMVLHWWGPTVWTLWSLFESQATLGVVVAAIVMPITLKAAFNERWKPEIY